MERLTARLNIYSGAQLPDLQNSYPWKFNEELLFKKLCVIVNGDTWFSKNMDLKKKLCNEWKSADKDRRVKIATYYVRDWGGIKTNKPATIERYVEILSNGKQPEFSGVASWSKIAAIVNPEAHAIFDTRVAFSLNALQFLSEAGVSGWFPKMGGRNTLIERVKPAIDERAKIQVWPKVQKEKAYLTYINLLKLVNASLESTPGLAPLEMVLFANAEALAHEVLRKLECPLTVSAG